MERMLEASCTGNLSMPQQELNSATENTKLALTDSKQHPLWGADRYLVAAQIVDTHF